MLTAFSFQLVGEALAGHFLRDLFPGVLLGDRGAHLHRQGPLRALRHRDVGLLGLKVLGSSCLNLWSGGLCQADRPRCHPRSRCWRCRRPRRRGAEGPRGRGAEGRDRDWNSSLGSGFHELRPGTSAAASGPGRPWSSAWRRCGGLGGLGFKLQRVQNSQR